MHISQISVNRPVTIIMFFIAVIMIGLVSLSRLSVDLLPDLSFPSLTIQTQYPDVASEEIESFVTKPIESIISTLSGIKRITSISREGVSLVTVEFVWGTDMDFATLKVREKLDRIRNTLPSRTLKPVIIRIDPSSQPVMSISISGSSLLRTKELSETVIKRRLEQIKGVALASVTGGMDREIKVTINPQLMNSYNVPLEKVISSLKNANFSLPGGTIKKGRFRYSLRTIGEFENINQLKNVVVGRNENGTLIYLKNIANIEDSFKKRNSITRFNGNESIGIIIQKEAGSNTVKVSGKVKKVLNQLEKEYPEIDTAVAYDQAEFISGAIKNVLRAIIYGGMLAFLVLFLFLHDFRNPVIIALSIPISIIATFILLYFANISLNMMSLSGLALGVGMLVDNSIVVLENIFRHRQEGKSRIEAAVVGAREISMPVVASTLTTIAVFLPIVFVKGVAGQLFKQQSLTVVFSLLTSLLVALTLLPVLASRFFYTGGIKCFEIEKVEKKKKIYKSKILKIIIFPFKVIVFFIEKFFIIFFTFVKELIKYWISGIVKILNRIFNPVFVLFDNFFERFSRLYERLLLKALENKFKVILILFVAFILSLVAGFKLD
ncbi:hypothetical protein DRQ09_09125, partial [candidate division KSB1 bacterium]